LKWRQGEDKVDYNKGRTENEKKMRTIRAKVGARVDGSLGGVVQEAPAHIGQMLFEASLQRHKNARSSTHYPKKETRRVDRAAREVEEEK